MDLHRRIRTLRLRREMTGMELARRVGVSPSYISLIEHGEKIPSEQVAVRIARVLGEREDLYRVWAATARMDERTRQAVLRLRGQDPALGSLGPAALTPDEGPEPERRAEPGDSRRPPGRPRTPIPFEFPVAHRLGDEESAPVLRIPLLCPGASPAHDPPAAEQVEALVAVDARLLDRGAVNGLVALRVDEHNGRFVSTWLRPRDLVIVDRHPPQFEPAMMQVVRLDDGLALARTSRAPGVLLVLPDPSRHEPPRALATADAEGVPDPIFGTVLWSARLWPLA